MESVPHREPLAGLVAEARVSCLAHVSWLLALLAHPQTANLARGRELASVIERGCALKPILANNFLRPFAKLVGHRLQPRTFVVKGCGNKFVSYFKLF
jgi:hypothetical protein